MISFSIPVEPKGQKRARHATRFTKSHKFVSTTYKDEEQRRYEELLYLHLMKHQPPRPIEGAVLFGCTCYLPIPKSKNKKFKKAALEEIERPIVTPDLDNLLKNIKDCLTKMRFWKDDRQVVGYLPGTEKFYSDRPRWEITIKELCES